MAHHQQLLDWIENELINQTLHLGDNLPDDRVLAREVGISQNHMRESLKHCEEIGVLRLYEGRKKSIIPQLVREPAASAGPAISLYLAGSLSPRQDLLSTCLLLESHALMGPDYDESAFDELDRIINAMQDATTSLSDFHDLEADFHIQLGRLSGNALISALLATLRDAMIEARFELVSQVPLWSATASRLRMEYRAIVDAARSGDATLAQTLLKANLQDRFAEAGRPLDLESSQTGEKAIGLAPIDVESQDLVPEEWGGTIEPELFEALATIQPIDADVTAEGKHCDETYPAVSSPRNVRGSVTSVVRVATFVPAAEDEAKVPDDDASLARESVLPEAGSSEDLPKDTREFGAKDAAQQALAKKRFDVVGYFGFRKKTSALPVVETVEQSLTSHKEADDEEPPTGLREGYEYATSDR